MAAAASSPASGIPFSLGNLLRLSTSAGDDGALYLCAARIILQRVRENDGADGGEIARETLLAGLLKRLELEERAAPTHERGLGVGEEGEGVGERWESVWQLCSVAAQIGKNQQKALLSFVCDCRHFQTCCCQLVSAALAVGQMCGALHDGHHLGRFLVQFYDQFWSNQIDLFDKHVGSITGATSDPNTVWYHCLNHLALLHTIQEMHKVTTPIMQQQGGIFTGSENQSSLRRSELETSTANSSVNACNLFLCEAISDPFAARLACAVPQVLAAVYKQSWNNDCEILGNKLKYIPTAEKKGVGLILKSGHQLDASLVLLGTVLAQWNGTGTVLVCCLETILQLSKLHFENLSKVTELVPEQCPPRLWYVIINSAICLHSMLTRLQSVLNPNRKYKPLFLQLLHSITEFTDTLTDHTITYHTHLIRYSLLHDADANNWSDHKPYLEGDRCSITIQMWHYHLRGLHDDLWGVRGGEVMVRILRDVLCHSVGFLDRRYAKVTPSYNRSEQLKADILTVLVVVEYFLPYISPPSSPSSPHTLTALTASCLSLVHTLSVGTSPLSHLHTSLCTSPHTPPPHAYNWIEFIDPTHFGIPATSNQNSDDVIRNFLNFVSLPYPAWSLLIKILLDERGRGLVVAVATNQQTKEEEHIADGTVLDHVCTVLSHCICRPQALADVLLQPQQGLRSMDREQCTKSDSLVRHFRSACSREWLRHSVKEALHWHVVTWCVAVERVWDSGELDDVMEKGIAMATMKNPCATMVTEHTLLLLDTLESALSQLPSPVTFTLLQLADKLVLNGESTLGEVLSDLLSDWLQSPPPPCLPSSHLSLSLSLILWTLRGARSVNHTPFPPHICRDLKEVAPLIRQRLKSFGTSLASPGSNPDDGDMEFGHDIIAEMLQFHPEAQASLHYIYQWLQLRKECILECLQLPSNNQSALNLSKFSSLTPPMTGFNPLEVGVSLGKGRFDHLTATQSIPWKDLLSFSLPHLSQDKLVRLVRNRFEFQSDAQLQDNEPQLVQQINTLLHL